MQIGEVCVWYVGREVTEWERGAISGALRNAYHPRISSPWIVPNLIEPLESDDNEKMAWLQARGAWLSKKMRVAKRFRLSQHYTTKSRWEFIKQVEQDLSWNLIFFLKKIYTYLEGKRSCYFVSNVSRVGPQQSDCSWLMRWSSELSQYHNWFTLSWTIFQNGVGRWAGACDLSVGTLELPIDSVKKKSLPKEPFPRVKVGLGGCNRLSMPPPQSPPQKMKWCN